MPKVPKRSPIWVYFNEYSAGVAKCSICDGLISTRGGSTSNLRRHLKYKHRKIIIEKKINAQKAPKSGKRKLKNEPEPEIHEEVLVVENYEGNSFHSEVLFHDYTAVEGGEVTVDHSYTQEEVNNTDWERQNVKKTNIQQQKAQLKLLNKLENLEDGIEKVNCTIGESSKTSSNTINLGKIDQLSEIGYNLARIATAFERIADHICGDPNGKQSQCISNDSSARISDNGLGAKVNDMILNVLGEEIVNTSCGASLVTDENVVNNDALKTSDLLDSLQLKPKNDSLSNNC